MKKIHFLLALLASSIFLLSLPTIAHANCGPNANDRICKIQNTSTSAQDFIIVRYYYITSAQFPKTFETIFPTYIPGSGISVGDTVMSLVDSDGKVVCYNDDIQPGILSSKIVVGSGSGQCNISSDAWYKLVIRSYSDSSGGECELYVNSIKDHPGLLPFGGYSWYTSWTTNESFQSATFSQKGDGPIDSVLILHDGNSYQDLKFDNDNGVGASARVETGGNQNGGRVIVGQFYNQILISPPPLSVKVYKNDLPTSTYNTYTTSCTNQSKDWDCDGLGNDLENALGTCPCLFGKDASCPTQFTPSHIQCLYAYDARDTDGDGLPDSWELFGREFQGFTELSRFDADPRHKDLFLEVDRDINQSQFTENHIRDVIKGYSKGPGDANFLRNPDGTYGIRIHVDIDIHNSSNQVVTNFSGERIGSFGNWEGSDLYDSNLQKTFSMKIYRRGLWRLINVWTEGSSSGKGGVVNLGVIEPFTFAHELGHHLGLIHRGDPDPSRILPFNCLPNYDSCMNYSYEYASNRIIRFSQGNLSTINSVQLNESVGLHGTSSYSQEYEYLKNAPYSFDVKPDGAIDWNRDGVISQTNVKAFVGNLTSLISGQELLCPRGGTLPKYFFDHNAQSSATTTGFELPSTSAPLQGGSSIAIFQGKLELAAIFQSNQKGHLLFRTQNTTGWSSWSPIDIDIDIDEDETNGHVLQTPTMVSTEVINTPILLIFYRKKIGTNYNIHYKCIKPSPCSYNGFLSEDDNVSAIKTDKNISIQKINSSSFYVYFMKGYKKANANIYRRKWSSGTWDGSIEEVKRKNGNVLTGIQVPTIADSPKGEHLFLPSTPDGSIEVYKKYNNDWELIGDVNASVFTGPATEYPKTNYKIAVQYIPNADSEKGFHLWANLQGGSLVRYVSKEYSTSSHTLNFHRRNDIGRSSIYGSPSLVLQNTSPFLRAACSFKNDGGTTAEIHYMPHADGIFDLSLPSSNDWKTMAKYICIGIASKIEGGGSAICENQ